MIGRTAIWWKSLEIEHGQTINIIKYSKLENRHEQAGLDGSIALLQLSKNGECRHCRRRRRRWW